MIMRQKKKMSRIKPKQDKKRKRKASFLFYLIPCFTATKNVEKHTFLVNSHSHPQSGESLGWRRGA